MRKPADKWNVCDFEGGWSSEPHRGGPETAWRHLLEHQAKDVDARVGIRAVVDGDTDAKRAAGALRSAMAAHFELIVQVASPLDEHTRLYAENEAFDVTALDDAPLEATGGVAEANAVDVEGEHAVAPLDLKGGRWGVGEIGRRTEARVGCAEACHADDRAPGRGGARFGRRGPS
mgnify:CR=1 FL=1